MSSSTAAFARLMTTFLDAEHGAQTRFLQALVRQPSDNPPGDCAAHGARARQLLEALGFTVEMHAVPEALVAASGMMSATNLIVRQRFGDGGPTIALNAHGDVVPPGLDWHNDPYGATIVEDLEHGPVMYGRGVAVSKSDFATYTWALRALMAAQRQGAALNGTIELHFTHDEEAGGSIGPEWILAHGLSKPDYAVSAGFSYGITSAHNGCLHLEVTVKGKQAHAAEPDCGIDAIEAASGILQALYGYRAELAKQKSAVSGIGHATLNVGLIQGGINTNVVPDRVSFRLDRRMIPEEAGGDAEGDLRRVIAAAAARYPGIAVSVQRLLLAAPLAALPGVEKLIVVFQRHAEMVFAVPVAVQGVPLYTDARHYAQRGIPTILYGAGPRTLREACGHSADENLRLHDLLKATKVVALALGELLR